MFDLLRERGCDARSVGEHRQPGRCRRHRSGPPSPARSPRSTSSSSTSSRRRTAQRGTRSVAPPRTRASRSWRSIRARPPRAGAPCCRTPARSSVERRPFELTSQANAIVMVDDLEPMIDVALARHGGRAPVGPPVGDHHHVWWSRRARRRLVRAVRLAGLGARAGHSGRGRRTAPGLCVERQPDRRHRDVRQAGSRAAWASCASPCRATPMSITCSWCSPTPWGRRRGSSRVRSPTPAR